MKYKHVAYTFLLALTSTLTQAQVKIGNNPTTITPGALLDIEGSATTTRTVSLPNGNFGIGLVSPVAKLDIAGDIGFNGLPANGKIIGHDNSLFVQTGTSGLSVLNNAADYNIMQIQNNGQVGIGVYAPATKLDIGGDIGFYGSRDNGIFTGHDNSLFLQTGKTGLSILNNAGSANLVEIKNSGNVGVNSPAPTAMLDIGGDIGFYGSANNGRIIGHDNTLFIRTGTQGLSVINSSQNINLMQIQNNGLVGIGTATPISQLDITGKLRINDATQGAGKILTSDANGVASWQSTQSLYIPKVVFAGRSTSEYFDNQNVNFTVPLNNFLPTPGYDAVAKEYVIQEGGFYRIEGGAVLQGTSESPGANVRVYVNTPYARPFTQFNDNSTGQLPALSTFWFAYFYAGDRVSISVYSFGTAPQNIRIISNTAFLTVTKLY